MRRLFLFFGLLLMLGSSSLARAHEVQSTYLELRQTSADTYAVLWKTPAQAKLRGGILLQWPADCQVLGETLRYESTGSDIERYQIRCPGGLEGRSIAITGAAGALADVLAQLTRLDGSISVFHRTPADPALLITAAPSRWQQSATYLNIGITHILTGVDHLLFVLGLLLIVQNRWMLVKTITGFTIAHSITLAVATLGYASAPIQPLYAAIALSILFLGPEIMRQRRGETSLTLRRPWVIAFSFGLLHGFSFASGLTDLGLARSQIPWALVCFNVGVEIGQLLFVALILLLVRSFRTLEIQWPRWCLALPAYTIGSLGAYWTIQRTVILFQSLSL